MNAAGKFYDAQKSNDYFTTIRSSLDDYQGDAAKLNAAFAVFATDESERGRQAEATQELVGIGEKGLVDRMTDIHTQIKDATDHIKSSFEESVDAASDALIEMDTLEALQNDFEAFYKTYDDLGTQIEDIATILQSKYGEYATFEMPDFETGREAFKAFCGGASGGGFLRECMDKFDEFDRTESAYLMGLGLEELLNELQTIVNSTSTIFASLDMSDPRIRRETINRLQRNGFKPHVFDGVGLYGADQNGLIKDKSLLNLVYPWRKQADNELAEFVRQHKGYEEYTDQQIIRLFQQVGYEGCGYAMAANSLMAVYEGRETEFEEIFGFPMIGSDGDYNFNMLMLDIYIETDDKFYLNRLNGKEVLANEILRDFETEQIKSGKMPGEEFERIYGVPLYRLRAIDGGGKYNDGFLEEAKAAALSNYKGVEAEYKMAGTTVDTINHRLKKYCEDRGVNLESASYRVPGDSFDISSVKQHIEEGAMVGISVNGLMLYDQKGEFQGYIKDGHWVTVTGVADDNKYYIVSTYGKQYYIQPNDDKGSLGSWQYYIMKYTKTE